VPAHSHGQLIRAGGSIFSDEFTGFTMVSAQLMASSSKVPDVRVLSNRPQPKLGDGSQDYSHSIMRSWKLPPGVHSLSNSHFNDRSWPKVRFCFLFRFLLLAGLS